MQTFAQVSSEIGTVAFFIMPLFIVLEFFSREKNLRLTNLFKLCYLIPGLNSAASEWLNP